MRCSPNDDVFAWQFGVDPNYSAEILSDVRCSGACAELVIRFGR